MTSPQKHVYFARPVGAVGPIKIGVSQHVESRMVQLSRAEGRKIEPMHVVDGGNKLEHALFHCFADIHLRGEWFHPHWRLVGFIEQLRDGVPLEEAIDLSDVRGHIFDYSNSAWKRPFPRNGGRRSAERTAA